MFISIVTYIALRNKRLNCDKICQVKIVSSLLDPSVADCLIGGGIVVARTDTIYGFLAQASNETAVERVYRLKDRDEHKSPIVLISSLTDLYDTPNDGIQKLCRDKWPGKVSIIIPSKNAPVWIRRENNSVAYRLPEHKDLQVLLSKTGPLIAPSANPEAHVPAMSVEEAYDYFGELVDVYVDGGYVYNDAPSQLLLVTENGNIERLR